METSFLVDETYEFCAPRFFDFLNKETDEQILDAERWFEVSHHYAPSPFMPKIKKGRSVKTEDPCEFRDVEQIQKVEETAEAAEQGIDHLSNVNVSEQLMIVNEEVTDGKGSFGFTSDSNPIETSKAHGENKSSSTDVRLKNDPPFAFPVLHTVTEPATMDTSGRANREPVKCNIQFSINSEASTPNIQMQTAKKECSVIKQPSGINPKNRTPAQPTKVTKLQKSATKYPGSIHRKNATDLSQENQAIKRQKLDTERSKKIHNVNVPVLLHKSKPGLPGGNDPLFFGVKGHQEMRKRVERYISTAEMVNRFQFRTREIGLPHSGSFSQDMVSSTVKMRAKLTLTHAKEPELETAHRVRAVRVKSSAELEEEMLAKVPKFKAKPVNKKILEASSLPTLPRSTPKPPEFHEFHLKTMERANQHHETASVATSVEVASQDQCKPLKLTEIRPPVLETSLRARSTRVKSSQELELEEFEKMPKFKAMPLNKKIFESKGDLGMFCQMKTHITTPQEFHFATNYRLGPPPSAMIDNFDKLSLHSESSHHSQQDCPRVTKPNPFNLQTEERGLKKEKLFTLQILEEQLKEEKARIPKANPYPYSTDYPTMPPKPQPKPSTMPEAFQLDSVFRHEVEMQKQREERERMEREEAERRNFKALPIIKEDPIPLPERQRKPLTEVQEFVLQVDCRAVERSEFDKKLKEKEMTGKRIREQQENEKKMEEEKELKHMRRAMVPRAKPIPKFNNPFHPHKSTKEITKPKSPMLLVNQRERRKPPTLHLR